MSQVMGTVASTASALDVNTQDLFSSFAVLTANGIQTSAAASGLKAAFSNIVKPTLDAEKAASALGIEFNASAVSTKGWQGFLVDLTEKMEQSEPAYVNAIQRQSDLTLKMKALEDAGQKSSAEYKAMQTELKSTNEEVEILSKTSGSQIEAFATMFGSVEALNSVLSLTSEQGMALYSESMDKMGSGTDYVTKAYETMGSTTSSELAKTKEQFKNTLAGFGEQMLPIVNDVLKGISNVLMAFNGLSDGSKKVILVIGGILALVGPILMGVGLVAGSIVNIAKAVTVVKGLKTAESVVKFTGLFSKLKGALSLTSIIGFITGPIGITIAAIAGAIAIGVLIIKNWDKIKETASNVFGGLGEFFSGIWGGIKEGFGKFKETMGNVAGDIKSKISEKWTSLKGDSDGIWGNIRAGALVAMGPLGMELGSKALECVDKVKANWGTIKTNTKETWENVKTNASTKLSEIKSTISSTFSTIGSSASKIGDSIKNGFNSALNFISGLPNKMFTWGSHMISGFVDGIKATIGKVTSAVSNVAQTVTRFLHFTRPDVGPLREYEEWMPHFMQGLALGIDSNKYLVEDSVKDLANGMNISNKMTFTPQLATANIPTSSIYDKNNNNNGGYTNNSPLLKVDTLIVRNDGDVDKISRGIYNANMKVVRGLGKRG